MLGVGGQQCAAVLEESFLIKLAAAVVSGAAAAGGSRQAVAAATAAAMRTAAELYTSRHMEGSAVEAEVDARLELLRAEITAQTREMFRTGEGPHFAGHLVARDAHCMANAAKHQFNEPIFSKSPASARRQARGGKCKRMMAADEGASALLAGTADANAEDAEPVSSSGPEEASWDARSAEEVTYAEAQQHTAGEAAAGEAAPMTPGEQDAAAAGEPDTALDETMEATDLAEVTTEGDDIADGGTETQAHGEYDEQLRELELHDRAQVEQRLDVTANLLLYRNASDEFLISGPEFFGTKAATAAGPPGAEERMAEPPVPTNGEHRMSTHMLRAEAPVYEGPGNAPGEWHRDADGEDDSATENADADAAGDDDSATDAGLEPDTSALAAAASATAAWVDNAQEAVARAILAQREREAAAAEAADAAERDADQAEASLEAKEAELASLRRDLAGVRQQRRPALQAKLRAAVRRR